MSDVRLTATNPEDSQVYPVACNDRGELLLQEPTVNGDDYVEKAGDHMTGDLILGASVEEPNVTLSASNGSVFHGDCQIDRLDINQSWSSSNDGSQGFRLSGGTFLMKRPSTSSNVCFRIYDSSESAGSTSPRVTIDSNGDSMWRGEMDVKGSFKAGDQSSTSDYITYTQTGGVQLRRYTGDSAIFRGYGNDGQCFILDQDGAVRGYSTAEFDLDVTIGSRGSKWVIVEQNGLAHLVAPESFQTASTADLVNPNGITPPPQTYPQLRNIPAELDMIENQLQKVMERLRMAPEAGWEVWDGSD